MIMDRKPYKIAQICLTDGTVCSREVEQELVNAYLGGTGLGLRLLQDCGDPSALLFLTGPLTDASRGGRFCAVTRSPFTGQILTPTSGNGWGAALKRAGWDGILLEGSAPEWISVCIGWNIIQLSGADKLLGLSTAETQASMPGCTVLAIGPAGEREVPLSAIFCGQYHAFSRGGIGAVMGAKKLKAIGIRCAEPPVHACARCAVRCSHAEENREPWADAYGLDGIGLTRMVEAAQALRAQGIAEIPDWTLSRWAAEISNPSTQMARLAGFGADTLRRAYAPLDSSNKDYSEKKGKKPSEQAALLDALGCCLFSAARFSLGDCAAWIAAVTGIKYTEAELQKISRTIQELESSIQ